MARDLTYLDFDVLLERVGKSRRKYRARVVNAPAGQTPPVAFTVPFTALELENFVLRIGRPQRVVRRIDAPETTAIKSFGGQLYRALFHDQLEVNLLRSLSEATARGAGLRIRLRLSDTPELAELPWEFLYDQTRNRFLCLSDRTPLVRFLEVSDPPRPLTVNPPLQVLVMIASPSDYPQLDVEQEWTKLRTALVPLEQAGQVQVTRLETATLAALRQQLRRADWHVLHFIGHGGFDPQTQDGVLVLEDLTGRGRLVSGQDLGVLLHDHDPLRLVVLNACEGARADPSDPFAGTAQSLIQQGIPAVVAMQFEITDPAAIGFASELYAAVADSYPLDAALAEARKAIWADGNQVEWATPVLHLRAPDGRIFNVAPTPAAAPTPPRPARKAATSVSPRPASKAPSPPSPARKAPSRPPPARKTPTPPDRRQSSTESRLDLPAHLVPTYTLKHSAQKGIRGEARMDVAFSPDSRLLATAATDGTARLWDVSSGKERSRVLEHYEQLDVLAFSPDGSRLAIGTRDGNVFIREIPSGRSLDEFKPGLWATGLAFSPDGRLLAIADYASTVYLLDAVTGVGQHEFELKGGACVAFSPDGNLLATTSAHGGAQLWKVPSCELQSHLTSEEWLGAPIFSPDGRWLAVGIGSVLVFDVASRQLWRKLEHPDELGKATFSPDGSWLVIPTMAGDITFWDASGRLRHTVEHDGEVGGLTFSPDGRWLAFATDGLRAVLWNLN